MNDRQEGQSTAQEYIDDLEDELRTFREAYPGLRSRMIVAEARVTELEAEIERLTAERDEARAAADGLPLELGYLTEQVNALKAELHYTDYARLEAEEAVEMIARIAPLDDDAIKRWLDSVIPDASPDGNDPVR